VDLAPIAVDVDSSVATVTISRPDHRNAMTYEMLDLMIEAFDRFDADDEVRAVVVTALGSFFSAGTDLSSRDGYAPGTAGFRPLQGRARDVGGELALRVFASTKPVLAAVNGTAVGIGVSMILPMDVRIAADDARFGIPFVRRGIVPESCASWFLPRVVGVSRAVEWAMTGRIFDAQEAHAAGLVRELLPAADVLPRTMEIAREIATNCAPVSVALTRQMMWRMLGEPHPMTAHRLETEALRARGVTDDVREGVASFRERRAPRFTGRVSRDMPDFYPWWSDEPFS
jgi:enoyl-CoA hydratase/carnithine racemase